MTSFRRAYRRYRTLWVSLIACAGFLALAIFGWGIRWGDLLESLWVAMLLLLSLIVISALVGFVLFRWRRWRDAKNRDFPPR